MTLVRVNAAIQLGAAAALATGRAPRLSAMVLAASLVPTTCAGHPFWEATTSRPAASSSCTSSRTSRCSAACSSPPVTPTGSPAWRGAPVARPATYAARPRQLAQSARQEARLAKAQVG